MIPTISQEIDLGDTTVSNSRLKAAQWFKTAVATGLIDVSQPGIEEIFLADLYRRAGDFQAASQILEQIAHQSLRNQCRTSFRVRKTLNSS